MKRIEFIFGLAVTIGLGVGYWRGHQGIPEPAVDSPRPAPLDPAPESLEVLISDPAEGEILADDIYDGLAGTVVGLDARRTLWTFVHDRYGWFLQHPAVVVRPRQRTFAQSNLRLTTPGRWEIHVCSATTEANQFLRECVRRGQWTFTELPRGVESLDSVTVERRASP